MAIGPFELLAFVFAIAGCCLVAVFGAVRRKRVERFALRQALMITSGNGNHVIRYLATTRRWRGALLLLAVIVSAVYFLVARRTVNINGNAAFAGWFVGAVIAEWRVDSLARGPQATAVLQRRRIEDYVRRPALVLGAVVAVVALGLAVVTLGVSVHRSSGQAVSAATLASLAVAEAAVALVARRVLQRPQPLAESDMLDADNAIRSRSLNVLTGSALAIGGYFAAISVGTLAMHRDDALVGLANLIGIGVIPLFGVIVGCAPRLRPVRPVARSLVA